MLVGSYQAAMGLMKQNRAAEKMNARKRQKKTKQPVSFRRWFAKEREAGGKDVAGQTHTEACVNTAEDCSGCSRHKLPTLASSLCPSNFHLSKVTVSRRVTGHLVLASWVTGNLYNFLERRVQQWPKSLKIPFIFWVPWENRNLIWLVVVFQSHIEPHSHSQSKAPCWETIKDSKNSKYHRSPIRRFTTLSPL